MSHYTVLVVGENPETQLEPFQENNMGDCPQEYLKFFDQEEEMMVDYKEGKGKEGMKHAEFYPTFEDFAQGWWGATRDPKTSKHGYWENPNAKWDWYQIGGRWTGFFKLKPGCNGAVGLPGVIGPTTAKKGWADQALKGEIDFDVQYGEAIQDAERSWLDWQFAKLAAEAMEEGEAKNKAVREARSEHLGMFLKPDITKEAFIEERSRISTFALLMDGKWYARGEMGWWAIVSDGKDPNEWDRQWWELVMNLPNDRQLTVFDCHI